MVEHGFQELVFEDAMEVIVDQLNALGTQDPLTIISLESNMRDGMLSNLVIMYMRMLTSCETQRRQDFFAPFIMVGVPDKRHHMFCTGMVSEQGQSCHCGADIGLCCAMPQPLGVADGFSLSQSRFFQHCCLCTWDVLVGPWYTSCNWQILAAVLHMCHPRVAELLGRSRAGQHVQAIMTVGAAGHDG